MRILQLSVAAMCVAAPLSGQAITYASKDSVDGQPKSTAFVGLSIRFNAFVDFYGLQGSPTFAPIEIPTDGSGHEGARLAADLRQTRLSLGGTNNGTPIGPIAGLLEMDFWGPNGTTVLRLRRAFVTARRLLIGQEWSSFSDLSSSPMTADWDGPPSGHDVRVVMIQYRSPRTPAHTWSTRISLEDPQVDLKYIDTTPIDSTSIDPSIALTYQRLPNLAASLRMEQSWGHLELAGLLLELRYRQDSTNQSALGYGLALSGLVNVGARDQLYLQALAGRGVSRYVTGIGGAGIDAIVYNAVLDAVPVAGGFLAYEHYWTPSLYSTGVLGGIVVRNDFNPTYEDYFRGAYGSVNLFLTPAPRLNLGTEVVYGWRKDRFGQDGDALRVYLITQYTL